MIEQEDSGTWSAWVGGLPVYAQGATRHRAEVAVRHTLAAYLAANPDTKARTSMMVATVDSTDRVSIVSPAALVGQMRSPAKSAAARLNGAKGGRPRKTATA